MRNILQLITIVEWKCQLDDGNVESPVILCFGKEVDLIEVNVYLMMINHMVFDVAEVMIAKADKTCH